MQVEAAEARRFQHRLGQDHAVGDDDGDVGAVGGERCLGDLVAQGTRRQHGDAEGVGGLMDGRAAQFHAAPGRSRRPGVSGHHLMAVANDFPEHGNGEIRRSHEDDLE